MKINNKNNNNNKPHNNYNYFMSFNTNIPERPEKAVVLFQHFSTTISNYNNKSDNNIFIAITYITPNATTTIYNNIKINYMITIIMTFAVILKVKVILIIIIILLPNII